MSSTRASSAPSPYARARRSLERVACACLALAVVGQALAQDPIDPRPANRRSYNQGLDEVRQLMTARQWIGASSRLDALLAQRPREAQARFLKGVLLTEQGHSDAAATTFRSLIEDYPEIPEPYNNLAVLYAKKGELDNARETLETAIKTAPEWAIAHENLGDIYARMAAQRFDRAANLDKSNKSAATKLRLARDLIGSNTAKPPP